MNQRLTCEKIDNCFTNAKTYRYDLPFQTEEAFVEKMGTMGALLIKKNLRRPFFRIETERGIQIKGILGDTGMKVSFPENRWEEEKVRWEEEMRKLLEEE